MHESLRKRAEFGGFEEPEASFPDGGVGGERAVDGGDGDPGGVIKRVPVGAR